MRIGSGFDVHAFTDGDHLMLGGVRIPYHQSFKAHSDGDVLIHALCDALLGALALGDIGQHFPDTEVAYAGADSRQLLQQVYRLMMDQGYHLANADITIIAEAPKMAPYIEPMREVLSQDLNCATGQLSIKATTTEGLGFAGRREGIAVQATVLLLN